MNKAVVTLGVSCLGAITVALGVIGALGVSTVALSASRGPATADTATPDSVMPPTGSGWQVPEATPADLVPIGQGGHRLRPVAAAGFAAWQAAYGRTIWITDSWRSATQQADCVRRKPTWCAPPSQSWHVKGLAVDVWLSRLDVAATSDPAYLALLSAAAATGWCRPTAREPWHFSFDGCG